MTVNDPHVASWIYNQAFLYEYTCTPCEVRYGSLATLHISLKFRYADMHANLWKNGFSDCAIGV